MLYFPRPVRKPAPITAESLGVYSDTEETSGDEWRRGISQLLLGVPVVENPAAATAAVWACPACWEYLKECHETARRGHWRDLEALLPKEPRLQPHRVLAAEMWLEDFLPPVGSVLEKLVRRLRETDSTQPSLLALLAAQAATFQLSTHTLLLGWCYWEWRCGSSHRVENHREFVDNAHETLTLMLHTHTSLPADLVSLLTRHDPSQLHTI